MTVVPDGTPATRSPAAAGIVVAIDGPAGVGKSTAARRVAQILDLPYLDTGAMYRALALRAIETGTDPDDPEAAGALAERVEIELREGPEGALSVHADGEPVGALIRRPEVGEVTSRLAVHPRVRARMVELQRQCANRGGVVEGRDIGTRVFPATPFKFFLTAAPEVRLRRRHDQLSIMDGGIGLQDVERELIRRDQRDTARSESPLVADGSYRVIDTSELSLDEVVSEIVSAVRDAP